MDIHKQQRRHEEEMLLLEQLLYAHANAPKSDRPVISAEESYNAIAALTLTDEQLAELRETQAQCVEARGKLADSWNAFGRALAEDAVPALQAFKNVLQKLAPQ